MMDWGALRDQWAEVRSSKVLNVKCVGTTSLISRGDIFSLGGQALRTVLDAIDTRRDKRHLGRIREVTPLLRWMTEGIPFWRVRVANQKFDFVRTANIEYG